MLSPPANRGEEPINPRTTPTVGLRPLNPCSAPRGDNLFTEKQQACGWRCALQLAGLGEGPMTIQGPTLRFGPTSQPCACSISHLKEPGGDGGQRVTRRPSPADTPSQGSL